MKILSIVGARPQFVKAALFRKHCHENGVNELLLHTGQHYDPEMSTQIFHDLAVKQPDFSLSLQSRSHGGMTGELLKSIEEIIIQQKPDFVNVFGDTNSTLAGALAASKLHVPVIHIEAGLRSFNKKMPEEINRILTDHISDYLFCPTDASVENLKNENITKGVHQVGDIMFDAVETFRPLFKFPKSVQRDESKNLATMTIHRADTTTDPERLSELIGYCRSFCDKYEVVFPIHPNTREKVKKFGVEFGDIKIVDPLGYLEMQGLLHASELVLTDSGGLQKEAYFHGCDCITLREETEWVETIEAGWNRLWRSAQTDVEKKLISEYGDGHSVAKMLASL